MKSQQCSKALASNADKAKTSRNDKQMTHEVLMSAENGLLRVAQVDDGTLVAINVAPLGKQSAADSSSLTGRIYLGHVERVVPHLQAAFVDIGLDRAGFLGAREARALVPDADRETPIEDCVQAGDTVLVQVTRPPQGEKGAQITADVTLPGRAVVLAPCRSRIAVSRSIEDEAERTRLADLAAGVREGRNGEALDVEGMEGPAGWVIRTAAIGLDEEALALDMRQAAEQWETLIDKAEATQPPALLHEDLGPIEKALRDLVRADTAHVTVEGEAAFRIARGFCRDHMPSVMEKLASAEEGEILFDRYDIAGQLETAMAPRVDLPSGGWLMIEATEAMTTIDVNSGSHDAPPQEVNLEAAHHIARQIRLRSLGGLIAIDFIDMSANADNEAILAALDAGFQGDKNPVRIGPMSEFGVVEMTRRRETMTLAQAMRQQG
jgi:ribonuclease G